MTKWARAFKGKSYQTPCSETLSLAVCVGVHGCGICLVHARTSRILLHAQSQGLSANLRPTTLSFWAPAVRKFISLIELTWMVAQLTLDSIVPVAGTRKVMCLKTSSCAHTRKETCMFCSKPGFATKTIPQGAPLPTEHFKNYDGAWGWL